MKKRLVAVLISLSLVGCSTETVDNRVYTQDECLDQGYFTHEYECKLWEDIPEEDQEQVIIEIADEIAEAQGISREEAYELMNDMIYDVLEYE